MAKKGDIDKKDLYKEIASEMRSKVQVKRVNDEFRFLAARLLARPIQFIKNRQKKLLEYKDCLYIESSHVKEAVKFQFSEVKRVMESGSMQTIRLAYFGAFKVKEERLKHLNKNSD